MNRIIPAILSLLSGCVCTIVVESGATDGSALEPPEVSAMVDAAAPVMVDAGAANDPDAGTPDDRAGALASGGART